MRPWIGFPTLGCCFLIIFNFVRVAGAGRCVSWGVFVSLGRCGGRWEREAHLISPYLRIICTFTFCVP